VGEFDLAIGDLKAKIREIFNRHKGRYGYRRVTAELRQQGLVVNHKTVQKLMVEMQLKSLVRPKRYKAYDGAASETAPDRLERDFTADEPNQKWVTDVTEFKVNNQKLYLSPVMDLYNREIVSYEIAERPLPVMIKNMLTKAFNRLDSGQRPILHSDQGCQGGFNWSSQHLQPGGVYGATRRMDEAIDREGRDALSGGSFASARGRAPVLGTDCNRDHQ
jgi:transposase InsO family protein